MQEESPTVKQTRETEQLTGDALCSTWLVKAEKSLQSSLGPGESLSRGNVCEETLAATLGRA